MKEDPNVFEYHERIIGVLRRRFVLTTSTMRISGVSRGNPFEAEIPLDNVLPKSHMVAMRTIHFRWASLAFLFLLFPFILFLVRGAPDFRTLLISGISFGIATTYLLLTLKRIELRQFPYRTGSLAFDVWRSGPDSEHFEEFISAIENQIIKHKNKMP